MFLENVVSPPLFLHSICLRWPNALCFTFTNIYIFIRRRRRCRRWDRKEKSIADACCSIYLRKPWCFCLWPPVMLWSSVLYDVCITLEDISQDNWALHYHLHLHNIVGNRQIYSRSVEVDFSSIQNEHRTTERLCRLVNSTTRHLFLSSSTHSWL